jgi:RNA polymerase primary sigma factor
MYLREMGGVELLSREGEIAIAKRIEAGKDVMINALTQSPLVAKKIYEWKEKLESDELLVRDIIDIDSTYEDFEASEENEDGKIKTEKKDKKDKEKEIGSQTQSIFRTRRIRSHRRRREIRRGKEQSRSQTLGP